MLLASRLTDAAFSGTYDIKLRSRRMIMFGIIPTHRDSPPTRRRPDLDRVILFPRCKTTGPQVREEPTAGLPRGRQADGKSLPGRRIFESKSRRSRKVHIERARRLLAADLTYIAHPSFDDPSAREVILAPSSGFESSGQDRTPVTHRSETDSSRGTRLASREQEAHWFRKMNYLKCLAARLRDRIDPHRPAAAELDEIERLQSEALKLRNRIVEANLRLVVSIANKRLQPGCDLSERVSDGSFALLLAVDHFDFARGNRFSTYATWAILNELARHNRRLKSRCNRPVALREDPLAAPDPGSDECERELEQNQRRTVVQRWLDRLDQRERRIVASRYGIGGGPVQTFVQIGRDLGISKERVRQLVARAHDKLRSFARLEMLEPSQLWDPQRSQPP
jgi:RNA polymerase primary sigma factor